MPIQPYEPPAESLQALREAARTMPKAYRHNAKMMTDVLSDVSRHWPHPVYRIGLKEMASTNGVRKAEVVGWRYLAQAGNDRNYAIEVQMDERGKDHQFAELDKGPYIDGIYRVLKDETLAKKAGATLLRPAFLRINALAIAAVWLRCDEPEKEMIIPLPPTPSYLVPWQQYSIKHFEDVLKQQATDKLANDFLDA
ncbi:MAG: hypothetical protein JST84_07305 [Acidobacteria bacterium]|nr:hypothetical protein [Acidobacteriota bacterium]